MGEIRKKVKKIVAVLLCLGMLTGMLDGVPGVGEFEIEAEAAGELGIYNNGLGEIWIDINDAPYTTFAQGSLGYNAYTEEGCAWFASARVNQLTGKGNTIWSGIRWLNNYQRLGFTKGSVAKAPSIICFQNHVAILEKIEGATAYVSEGGYTGKAVGERYGFTRIVEMPISKVTTYAENFKDFVYLDGASSNPGQPVTNIKPEIRQHDNSKFDSLTETSFCFQADFKNPTRGLIEDLGMILKDEAGREITRNHESRHAKGVGSRTPESFIYVDTAKDMGIALTPDTAYKYQFYIKVNGTEYFSEEYSTRTGGDSVPNTPDLSVDKTDIAAGDSVNVKWNADRKAVNGYEVTVTSQDGTYQRTMTVNDVNASGASVALPNVGTYKITVVAKGRDKNSETAVLNKLLTAHGKSKVTFVQNTENGEEVLKVEEVGYGYKATPPSAPSKEGYTFQGWDRDYSNVTGDLKVAANYKINTYTIKFVGENGNVLKEEKAVYKSSVQPPEAPESSRTGYIFGGWSSNDYENVKKNATIIASYVWENMDLPIIVEATKCEYKESGYLLTYNIINYPNDKTTGRAIASLKTANGKLVATTESNAFTVDKAVTKTNQEIFIPYEGVAATAEIVIVDKFSSGIPISVSRSCAVTREWSPWSTEKPEGDYEVESRTEYRSKDKVTTTSSASALSGWTRYNSSWTWSGWGAWSSWSRNSIGGSDSRQVETKNVTDSNGYTNYKYYYWRHPSGTNYSFNQYANYTYHEYNTASPLKWLKNTYGHDGYVAHSGYINYRNELWFLAGTNNVPGTSHTEWRYRDRSKVYTYYYYKWNGWSAWSAEPRSSSDSRQVETRTTYRYKSNIKGEEDNSGVLREVTGSVPTEFAGKQATLLVYKNEEAADYNNEYVGQTEINENGSYYFSFFTREEPSAQTGDFTIDLALEGATEAIYLDTIKAPLPKYTVTFTDWNGETISEQKVTQGGTAVLPENPKREHYIFKGWDTGTTNVRDNLIITAQYEKETYSVVWVDWSRQNFAVDTYSYGEELLEPSLEEIEGYDLVSWKDETGETPKEVTKNLVLTAEYKIKQYTVKFYDWEGNCINTQLIEHGKSALIPETPTKPGMVFGGWSSSDYICVTSDLNIYPNFTYEETVATPTVDMASGAYEHSFEVKLTGEEGSVLYYTTDGSTPDRYSKEYTGSLTIEKNTVLQFIACKEGKNMSPVQKAVYLISENEDTAGILKIKKSLWEMEAGDGTPFQYTLYREDGKQDVEFFSLNEDVAVISENGELQANGEGSTQIFAVTTDLKYADFCTVTVTSNEVLVTAIKVENPVVYVSPENSEVMVSSVEPLNATYTDVSWYSEDSSIAEINEEGQILGKKLGTTSVRGYSYGGNCYVDCTVVVTEPSVELNDTALVLQKGEKITETATIVGTIEQSFQWESDNEEVAAVDENGVITAKEPGQATIRYISADRQYEASVIVIVTEKSEKADIAKAVVTGIKDSTYTGGEIVPEISVTYEGEELKKQEDYSVVLNKNINAGTATVYIIGKGEFTGVLEQSFHINPMDISGISISSIAKQKATGSAVCPSVVVKYNNKTLEEGIDYKLIYADNVKPGKATLTLEGTGNYTGRKVCQFEIVAEASGAVKPTVTPGAGKPETVKAPARPVIKYLKNVSGKKISIKLAKKVNNAAGYQITYATDKKFKKGKKNITTKSTAKTISRLKKGKTYYVKVRAYAKDTKGKKVYGRYSTVKKVKIKK